MKQIFKISCLLIISFCFLSMSITAQEVEEMPVMMDQEVEPAPSGRIEYVSSDLRKEFPKQAHIELAKQEGINIEEIYYYNNKSQVLGIYINTPQKLADEELKEIQTKIYRILWDFDSADIITFFKDDQGFYSLISSKKEWGTISSMVYDYPSLLKECKSIIDSLKNNEDYPLKDQEIYGVFMRSGLLNSKEKSDLKKISLYFITKGEDNTYKQYSAYNNKIHMRNPLTLYKNEEGLFINSAYGNTLKVDAYGNFISHGNDINFIEKYNDFFLKID